ncbi:RagB/SusD family nutrient uptake outer membrane protein [Pedobacter sp. HMF7647]|uniref:RagB/SusD family nutrient uptake outer membrane protein n=1 Tax=Hufsiella arboris TaxID=2695275 RepID=A0A7K1Y894_9SPHI|nr:RagB/SusD family nutrient uptake outer membrane protein [Hufsiella arboris]MXV50309.1 RagB/SusD family nutrient uptake outer membrane protein [Hufsiella arboris]
MVKMPGWSSLYRWIFFASLAGITVLISAECRKFVEIDQPDKGTLVNTADYESLLNNTFDINYSYYLPWLSADDLDISDTSVQQQVWGTDREVYIWAADFMGDQNDPDWDRLYKQVYIFNEIIAGIPESRNGSPQQKRQILAEAKMNRAYSYLDLVCMYARWYNPSTAAGDPGVPLLLMPSFTEKLFRASVQAVYGQIINDLKAALPDLPALPLQVTRASAAAAYATLARTYLNMGNYRDALASADSALARKSSLLNLSLYRSDPLPLATIHPEIIFYKQLSPGPLSFYPLSEGLQHLFSPEDLRWQLFTADGLTHGRPAFSGRCLVRSQLSGEGISVGPDVPEMMLIKAECLARLGAFTEAMTTVNTLRRQRFSRDHYLPLAANNSTEVLQLVLQERRRELFGRGTRWFDQKRLNREPAFSKTTIRIFLGVSYMLEPNSNRYVFPIAKKYLAMNPEIVQNPR